MISAEQPGGIRADLETRGMPTDIAAGGIRADVARRAAQAIAECCSRIALQDAADGAVVIEVEGELDGANAVRLEEALAQSGSRGTRLLVVDFSRTSFIDLSGMRALLEARRRFDGETAPRLVIAGINCATLALLRAARIERLFECYPSVDEALGAASNG